MDSLSLAELQTPGVEELRAPVAQFHPTPVSAHIEHLSPGDRAALIKLIQASRVIDDLFLEQVWKGNKRLSEILKRDDSELGVARRDLYAIHKSAWSELDENRAFLPDVPAQKRLGANFYPEDMNADEFEDWVGRLPPDDAALARGFFSVIRRDESGRLQAVPYSREYREHLKQAGLLLRQAARDTDNVSLRNFLELRAAAFSTDDYYASDIAWMEVDAPLDVTIGPYETYMDELLGYKAAFESYVCVTDEAETAKVQKLSHHLQAVEDHLPIEAKYRNPRLPAMMPIRVVNEVISGGDGNHGVRTAAFNLPNDERVVQKKGSKKVMLRNVQHAKFDSTLLPIARSVLSREAQSDVDFDSFFTHILAHELSHGIGPHELSVNGRKSSVRLELRDAYSALEEAKADVTGLFMVQFFLDHGILAPGKENERKLYATFLASAFRTLRFGITEAHGRGMALQFNYFLDHGAFHENEDGTFSVIESRMKQAVRDLTRQLLTIEAEGDYHAAQAMLSTLGVMRPSIARVLDRLGHIPVDIRPIFIAADELAPAGE